MYLIVNKNIVEPFKNMINVLYELFSLMDERNRNKIFITSGGELSCSSLLFIEYYPIALS